MPTVERTGVFQHLRRAALLPDGGSMSDGQLLECFVARQDETAFEVLVRRHGPMVLGVCRRVLRDSHDADDAFQATFLVLVRKAASIRQCELLGNWLYGVAYRTALDARSTAVRRRLHEKQVDTMPEPEIKERVDQGPDLRPFLDQELAGLPHKYRVAVVLCDLQERTRKDVARQLGIPEGTLSGRLTTARRILARRLARRGVGLSAVALTAALSQSAASASVPAPLLTTTVQAALAVAAGRTATAVVSAKVAALTEGALRAMFITKLKIAGAALLVATIVFGAAFVTHQPSSAQPPTGSAWAFFEVPAADNDAGKPKVLELGSGQRGRRVVWSPDGKTLVVVTKQESMFSRKGSAIKLWDVDKGEARGTLAEDTNGGLAFQHVVFSADGKTIAATVTEEKIVPGGRMIVDVVKLWDAKTLALKQTLGGDSQLVCVALSADGKLVAAGSPSKKAATVWNAESGAAERTFDTGEAQPWSLAFLPDSAILVVGAQKGDGSGEVSLWHAGTGILRLRLLTSIRAASMTLSADGKLVAGTNGGGEDVDIWQIGTAKQIASLKGLAKGARSVAFAKDSNTVAAGTRDGKVLLWDVETGKLKETLEGHGAEVYSVAFSPDGKTLASTSQDQTVRLWPIGKRTGEKK
jgi:RNA polymerase sigma factor (sigma-70 family)